MENKLVEDSIEFALKIISMCKTLQKTKHEYSMSDQLLRAGTSIGANIHEANFAISRADFASKMQIALKECNETEYWLTLLFRSGYVDKDNKLLSDCIALKKMLISTCKTAKS